MTNPDALPSPSSSAELLLEAAEWCREAGNQESQRGDVGGAGR